MLETRGSVDLEKLFLKVRGEQIPCLAADEGNCQLRVVPIERISIPAGQESLVNAVLTKSATYKGCGLIAGPPKSNLTDTGILVARTLVNTVNEVLPVRVMNIGAHGTTIQEGTVIGLFSAIDEDSITSPI